MVDNIARIVADLGVIAAFGRPKPMRRDQVHCLFCTLYILSRNIRPIQIDQIAFCHVREVAFVFEFEITRTGIGAYLSYLLYAQTLQERLVARLPIWVTK